jgi:hypothetical protein
MVITLAGKKSSRWVWVLAFCLSLSLLLYSIYRMTKGVKNTVSGISKNIEESLEKSFQHLDSSGKADYHGLDNTTSFYIDSLKKVDFENGATNVPKTFYTYWGFRDYYRLPLTYPFSIHCIEELDNGQLFNEKWVTAFDRNDNGETPLSLNAIN